jgi:hypothetical protein
MNTITIAIIGVAIVVIALVVKHLVSKKISKEAVDVFEENLNDETIKTASELCKENVAGPEPAPKPDVDNTFTPTDTSAITVVEPEEINGISEENQICPFEIKTDGQGNIIKTDSDRDGGVDPLAEIEKMLAEAPKTTKKETKKTGKKTGKKPTRTAKKAAKKAAKKVTVPAVRTVETKPELPDVRFVKPIEVAVTPKKRGRKSKKNEG